MFLYSAFRYLALSNLYLFLIPLLKKVIEQHVNIINYDPTILMILFVIFTFFKLH